MDTSLVVDGLFPGTVLHRAADAYLQRLIAVRSIVYVSMLVHIEALQALVAVANDPQRLRESLRRQYRLRHWGRIESVRANWLEFGLQELDRSLNRFPEARELLIDSQVIASATRLMARFQIKSNDAVHVSAAQSAGVPVIATTDADFARITDPTVITVHLIR